MTPAQERRVKSYAVSWNDLMAFLTDIRETPTMIQWPKMKLPADAVVLGVFNNHLTGGFDFHVASAEFEPVDEAIELPRVKAEFGVCKIAKAGQLDRLIGAVSAHLGNMDAEARDRLSKLIEEIEQ